jgi:hypothetical protein
LAHHGVAFAGASSQQQQLLHHPGPLEPDFLTLSKRFSKKQQMQWTKKGAHLVLQMRSQVLDERLGDIFRDWYPDFRTQPESKIKQAA